MLLCSLRFALMSFGVRRIMGELIVVGIAVGFTASTCAYMIGWTIAQVRRLVRSIR